MNQNITIGNVCFIFDQTNQNVLLLKRNKEPMKGQWTGVGGKTDFLEDINISCIREVKEETGILLKSVKLKAVVKTILQQPSSSWLLFVYFANTNINKVIKCQEGILKWVPVKGLFKYDLIDFIKLTLQNIDENNILEGTIIHNTNGRVIDHNLISSLS